MTSKSKFPPPPSGPYIVSKVLALSATMSAALSFTIDNPGWHTGLAAYFTIHSFPGSASTTANIAFYAVDPATSGTYSLNAPGVARSATGMTRYALGNTLVVAGNSAVNVLVPNQVIIQLSVSTGATSKDILFSLGIEWIP